MNTKWLKGFKGEALEKRKKELASYKNAFQALEKLLREDFFEEGKSIADYDSPSWSHKQADMNGANRKLRSVLSLIKTD